MRIKQETQLLNKEKVGVTYAAIGEKYNAWMLESKNQQLSKSKKDQIVIINIQERGEKNKENRLYKMVYQGQMLCSSPVYLLWTRVLLENDTDTSESE